MAADRHLGFDTTGSSAVRPENSTLDRTNMQWIG